MLIKKEFGPYSTPKEFKKVKQKVDAEDERLFGLGYVLYDTDICKTKNGSLIIRNYARLSPVIYRNLFMGHI